MGYTAIQLKKLAKENPQELIKLINNSEKDIVILTFGAEIIGEEFEDELVVLPIFKRLLKHIHALVRESAMIGISSFYFGKQLPEEIRNRLEDISKSDPSPVLKEYASDLLGDFN
jgi:hypothetical protein